jgi:hypothetical protein
MIYEPEDVAETFVGLVERPRAEVAVGWPARAGQVAYALAPGPTEHALGAAFRRYLRRADPAPRTEGALMEPVQQGRSASGGLRTSQRRPSKGSGKGSGRSRSYAGLALAAATVTLGTAVVLGGLSRNRPWSGF